MEGQGHSEVKCTFPAVGYPSTSCHPAVDRPAEASIDGDVASRLFICSVNLVVVLANEPIVTHV